MRAPAPILAVLACAAAGLSGCTTHLARLEPVRAAWFRGDLAEAERLIHEHGIEAFRGLDLFIPEEAAA